MHLTNNDGTILLHTFPSCVWASLFLVNLGCLFFLDSWDWWCFIFHIQLTLTFFSLSELDESSSRQSATVAAVWQREEVGTHLWSGGHQSLICMMRCDVVAHKSHFMHRGCVITRITRKVMSYFTHQLINQPSLQSNQSDLICAVSPIYWISNPGGLPHCVSWPQHPCSIALPLSCKPFSVFTHCPCFPGQVG